MAEARRAVVDAGPLADTCGLRLSELADLLRAALDNGTDRDWVSGTAVEVRGTMTLRERAVGAKGLEPLASAV